MKLAVIIPVYNEKNTIRRVLDEVWKVPVEKEIIVVDDGSTDGTREILLDTQKEMKDIRLFLKKSNTGKGSAIRTGLSKAKGNIAVIQDGDMEYDPLDFMKMLEVMKNKKAEVVYGSRFLEKNNKFLFLNFLANKLITFLTNVLYGVKLTDVETCYKMVKTNIFQSLPLRTERFEIEAEITTCLLKRRINIIEVPVTYRPRNFIMGKKIGWKDGIATLFFIIKTRFEFGRQKKNK
jgi:dolichol-phosphate mannosyltransferase